MLSFLYPVFLIGAAAAAVPILLHLLRHDQAREVRFSAMRLLQGVRVEHTHRRRIHNWLLLAMRVAALLLLALAFARPYFTADRASRGGATLIVLDRSGSMAAPAVWAKARQAALAAVASAPAGEPLGLVAFDDRPELVVEPTLDRGAVRSALARVSPGSGATRFGAAVARAIASLDNASAGSGRIVLVSDLQGTPAETGITVPQGVTVDVVSVAEPFDNLALLSARRAEGGIVATIRNDGASPRRVGVRVESPGLPAARAAIDLAPSQTADLPVAGPFERREATVHLDDPDTAGLGSDNTRYISAPPTDRTRILVVSPPENAFYVDAALRAGTDQPDFDVAVVPVQAVTTALGGSAAPQVVFLVGARGLDRGGRDTLVRFAQNGGGIFVAAPDAVNEPGFASLLDGLEAFAPRGDDPLLTLASFEARHPLFRSLGPAGDGLGGARFTRAWRVRADGWQILARFDDGAGALYERAVGAGRIVFFASDVNRGWNDLPVQSAFVPFVQETARYLAPARARVEYTPAMLPPALPARLGFVDLEPGRRVVVNADVRESDPARMDAAQFRAAIKHRGARRHDAAGDRRRARAAEGQQGWWRYGLGLMLAALVVEGVIAGRARVAR